MPSTTSAKNARDVAIFLDDADGDPVEISGSANSVKFAFTQELGAYRVFQEAWTKRLASGKDASFQIDVVFSTASDEGYALIRDWFYGDASDAPRTLQIVVPRDADGSDSYSAEALIAEGSIPMEASDAEPILVSVELLPDGAVTHSVI